MPRDDEPLDIPAPTRTQPERSRKTTPYVFLAYEELEPQTRSLMVCQGLTRLRHHLSAIAPMAPFLDSSRARPVGRSKAPFVNDLALHGGAVSALWLSAVRGYDGLTTHSLTLSGGFKS